MINSSTSAIYKRFTYILVVLLSMFLLAGCGSSSSSKGKENADPKGFYTGTASIKESNDMTDLMISDLQGMVSGNRFMFLSVDQVLLYDGTITDIDENDYRATVNIYEDGMLLASTMVSGTVIEGSSITGTFAGSGAGNGTFNLTYSMNNSASDLVRVDDQGLGKWQGTANSGPTGTGWYINSSGEVSRSRNFPDTTPVFAACEIDSSQSTIEPIPDVNVYNFNIVLSDCMDPLVNGAYTGFATTRSAADEFLVFAISNGSYSGSDNLEYDLD